jgi:hypothetical protein
MNASMSYHYDKLIDNKSNKTINILNLCVIQSN